MIAVIQRVNSAAVRVEGEIVGKCDKGLCILLGVAKGDQENDAEVLAKKILGLRIFEDGNGKMNLSVLDVGGGILTVSNFTLLAAYRKGNRPDYMGAEAPVRANELYKYFSDILAKEVPVGRGIFGADMQISLECDGPVTIVMDSKVLIK